MDPSVKQGIRQNTIGTLAVDDKDIRQSAAQAVAAVALKDLPVGEWTEILGILQANAVNVNPEFRMASLMTLGYICEAILPDIVTKE